ncbi:MAG: DNA-formamidopyrimidine glycosylase family protein [Myxococcota bacterium]
MPEGDSLHKLAATLRPAFVGQPVEHLRLRERGEVAAVRGHAIDRIEAVGKNLLVLIDRRFTVRVHLGLKGRWRLLDATRPWDRAAHAATLALAVPATVLVVYGSMRHELRPYRDMRLEQELRRLGPDLLAPEVDFESVVARARAPGHRDEAITDLLLNQRVASGLGNVYRSEVLFSARVYPWRRVASLDDDALLTLFKTGSELMRKNLGPGPRITVEGGDRPDPLLRRRSVSPRFHVYRRAGLPCLRCGTRVRRSTEGRMARSTYWCPRCQPGPD